MPDNQTDRIRTPVEIASRMFLDQNDRLPSQLLGPERPTREQKVGGVSQDLVIDEVLKDLEILNGS
jgi:hypothetical protein